LRDTLSRCGRCSIRENRSNAIEDETPTGHFAMHTRAAAAVARKMR
jgi:hypothetical protein